MRVPPKHDWSVSRRPGPRRRLHVPAQPRHLPAGRGPRSQLLSSQLRLCLHERHLPWHRGQPPDGTSVSRLTAPGGQRCSLHLRLPPSRLLQRRHAHRQRHVRPVPVHLPRLPPRSARRHPLQLRVSRRARPELRREERHLLSQLHLLDPLHLRRRLTARVILLQHHVWHMIPTYYPPPPAVPRWIFATTAAWIRTQAASIGLLVRVPLHSLSPLVGLFLSLSLSLSLSFSYSHLPLRLQHPS